MIYTLMLLLTALLVVVNLQWLLLAMEERMFLIALKSWRSTPNILQITSIDNNKPQRKTMEEMTGRQVLLLTVPKST